MKKFYDLRVLLTTIMLFISSIWANNLYALYEYSYTINENTSIAARNSIVTNTNGKSLSYTLKDESTGYTAETFIALEGEWEIVNADQTDNQDTLFSKYDSYLSILNLNNGDKVTITVTDSWVIDNLGLKTSQGFTSNTNGTVVEYNINSDNVQLDFEGAGTSSKQAYVLITNIKIESSTEAQQTTEGIPTPNIEMVGAKGGSREIIITSKEEEIDGMYYTMDGEDPISSSAILYQDTIKINTTTTIKAIIKKGEKTSDVVEFAVNVLEYSRNYSTATKEEATLYPRSLYKNSEGSELNYTLHNAETYIALSENWTFSEDNAFIYSSNANLLSITNLSKGDLVILNLSVNWTRDNFSLLQIEGVTTTYYNDNTIVIYEITGDNVENLDFKGKNSGDWFCVSGIGIESNSELEDQKFEETVTAPTFKIVDAMATMRKITIAFGASSKGNEVTTYYKTDSDNDYVKYEDTITINQSTSIQAYSITTNTEIKSENSEISCYVNGYKILDIDMSTVENITAGGTYATGYNEQILTNTIANAGSYIALSDAWTIKGDTLRAENEQCFMTILNVKKGDKLIIKVADDYSLDNLLYENNGNAISVDNANISDSIRIYSIEEDISQIDFYQYVKGEYAQWINIFYIGIESEEERSEEIITAEVSIDDDSGLATYCNEVNSLDFTDVTDIYAYSATVEGTTVNLKRETIVPQKTGILLRNPNAKAISNVKVPIVTQEATIENNYFVAVYGENQYVEISDNGYTNFVLAKKKGSVGFYKAGGITVEAGKAYLQVSQSNTTAKNISTSKSLTLNFTDDDTNGIVEVSEKAKTDSIIYSLKGLRAANPVKGIYIMNGKKVVVK